MTATRVSLKLCTYSRSELLEGSILAECPIELTGEESEHCPCRRREVHQAGRVEVRVVVCKWPALWNGRQVVNPPAFADATRRSCAHKVEMLRIEQRRNEAMAKEKNGMAAPGRLPTVAVADPPGQPPVVDAETVTAVVPVTTTAVAPPAEAQRPAPAVPVNLAAALALAQQKCQAVRKDARNAHHGYRYASAEAVIAEAKRALADTGLALVPSEQALNRAEGGGFELVRKFLLIHVSGESLVLGCAWPVIEERGRPVDKATAISATASLSYLLRDLLLMPRVSDDADLAGRNDPKPAAKSAREIAAEKAQAPAAQPAAPPAAPAEKQQPPTPDQLARLRALREQLFTATRPDDPKGAWQAILSQHGVTTAGDLSPVQAKQLIDHLSYRLTNHDLEQALGQDGKGG